MDDSKSGREVKLIDYLYILFKWRKLLVINLVIAIVVSVIFAFLIPKTYKATSTFMLAPED
ncbi:hypothetical protein ACFLS9_02470, partial [Bacteroidota bacterium]